VLLSCYVTSPDSTRQTLALGHYMAAEDLCHRQYEDRKAALESAQLLGDKLVCQAHLARPRIYLRIAADGPQSVQHRSCAHASNGRRNPANRGHSHHGKCPPVQLNARAYFTLQMITVERCLGTTRSHVRATSARLVVRRPPAAAPSELSLDSRPQPTGDRF
jgi:hypothetical protein